MIIFKYLTTQPQRYKYLFKISVINTIIFDKKFKVSFKI